MLVNAHDHFEFYKDIDSGLKKIEIFEIYTLVNSTTLEEYQNLKNNYSLNPLLKIGFGIHPWKVEKDLSMDYEKIIQSCDFIGEIGLDFYWDTRKNLYNKQKEVFEYFLKMAKKYDKLVNIHTKGAELEVLNYLKQYKLNHSIIHWYSGPLEYIPEFLELGCYFTIGPDVGYSEITDNLIDILPINKILTETDGPTSIEWVNGIYSESEYIITILKYIAQKKNLSYAQLQKQIFYNYKNLNI